jgi:hypothetical protein
MPATPRHSDVLRDLADARRAAGEALIELSRADQPVAEQKFALGRTAAVLEAASRTVRTFLAGLGRDDRIR